MLITKRRIRKLDNYLGFLKAGQQVAVGVAMSGISGVALDQIGFSAARGVGETVLPAPVFGPVSRYNANGQYIIHRDQPKETAYREVDWHWEEFRGPYETESVSKIVDVPYERYPRTFVPPPAVELSILKGTDGRDLVATPALTYSPGESLGLLHAVNLLLEIFGMCEVFTSDLHSIIRAPLKRLNWRVLPPGKRPWQALKAEIDPIVSDAKGGNQPVIRHRFETVNSYEPEFCAIGQAGFHGYIVFGFPELGLYVLESIYTGNATYVFGEDWETLSKRTKAEVLNEGSHVARLIHREGWDMKVEELLAT